MILLNRGNYSTLCAGGSKLFSPMLGGETGGRGSEILKSTFLDCQYHFGGQIYPEFGIKRKA